MEMNPENHTPGQKVRVHIDRVVVHGRPPADKAAFEQGVRQALSHEFSKLSPGAAARVAAIRRQVDSIHADSAPTDDHSRGARVGSAIFESVTAPRRRT